MQVSSDRQDIRIVFWCTVTSLIFIASLLLGEVSKVDFIWTTCLAIPYLLILLFLGIDRLYVGLIMAVEVGAFGLLLCLWALGMGIGQAQGFIGHSVKLFFTLAFIFIQGTLLLSALLTMRKIPDVARTPRAWMIVLTSLLGLFGLPSVAVWMIGLVAGHSVP